jgi:uroporphyrinogen III methyltransferase/synthase
MEQRVTEEGIGTPAIIVVGEVTALDFASTYHEPLEGVRVAVTGTDLLAAKLRKSLEEAGAYTECVLSMELESHRSGEAMKTAYERLADYGWIVFTSANAVREFFLGLLESGGDNRRLGHVKFAAVGKGTAKELLRYGFTTDYTPEEYCAAALAEGLKRVVKEGERLLIPRSFKGSPALVEILDSAGIVYDDIVLYDVAERRKGAKEMAESLKKADYLTFASGSGVDAFFENAGEDVTALLDGIRVVCIGDITARKLEEHGRKADVTAARFTVEGMTEAISRDWNRGSEN